MHTQTRNYPEAERGPVIDDLFGRRVADPYRWLEDTSDPRTRRWIAAQAELWFSQATTLPERYRFRRRVAELTRVGMIGVPVWRGDVQFYERRTAAQEHPMVMITDRVGDRVLVDPAALDPSGRTALDTWHVSPDGRLLAFQVSRGDERGILHLLDVGTGEPIDRPIDDCRYSPVAWLPDSRAFYYVRSRTLRLHRVGSADDHVVLGEPAAYGLELSHDGRWLIISAGHGTSNDLWLADLTVSEPEFPALVEIQRDIEARSVITVGPDGRLYAVTTLGADAGRICVGDPRRPQPEHWRDLIPERAAAPLSHLAFLEGAGRRPLLLVGRTVDGIAELGVHDRETGAWLGDVPLPGAGTVGSVGTRPAGGHEAWFDYTDTTTPTSVHRYDAHTGRTTLWSRPPGADTTPPIEVHRLSCHSADGTEITLVVHTPIHDQVTVHDQPRPTILYGYGGFGQSLIPTYSAFSLAWVEAGGVFATANLRGGAERGEAWHRAGMRDAKQNVFDDFVAAAEKLINDGWTTPDRLGIFGESNGGLTVGAVVTRRPELFAAAVCASPVLDLTRYELSGRGPEWVAEYGSAADPEQLDWLLGYSPYHHVIDGVDYPAVLFTVSDDDARVDPLHARKMCAALQRATTGAGPVLIRTTDGVGHSSGSVSSGVGLAADVLAFLAAHTGLTGSGA
jgi:prolyl oligopeptidase